MKTRKFWALVALTIVWGMFTGSMVGASELRFSPLDQNIQQGEEGCLSIMLDEALEVRTIEVTVTFDGSILSGLEGGGGAAFQDLPCSVWQEYSSSENQWTGFAVALGADCFIVDPGELFYWNFSAENSGVSEITAVLVTLYDRFGVIIPGISLQSTSVVVGTGSSPVGDYGVPILPSITSSPNPFNPQTNIKFWLPQACEASLVVYDLKGRCVRKLLTGPVSEYWTIVRWDGRADSGHNVPSGVYLYQLVTAGEVLSGRMTLAR